MSNKKQPKVVHEFMNTGTLASATKQQEKNIAQIHKGQRDAEAREFKLRARTSALQDAKYIERNGTNDAVLKTADKLYQWLIKVLK